MKKNFKLIIFGIIIVIIGVLAFGDKIAEITNLDANNIVVKFLKDNPLIDMRDSGLNKRAAEANKREADIAKQREDRAEEDRENAVKAKEKAEGSASNYDYFTVEVVNMPVTAGINNIAIISASYFTDIPSSDEVVFKSGVDWTNKLGVTTKSFGKRVKELSSLDYNNYPKNKWKTIGK